jgi:Na+-driven multidrug efflux pump
MDDVRPAGALSTLHRLLFERDHTEGSLLASIAVLALPALAMGLAGGALFQVVELWFVGHLGPAGTAAFGVASQALGKAVSAAASRRMLVAASSRRPMPSRSHEHLSRSVLRSFQFRARCCLLGDADVIARARPARRRGFMFAQIFGMLFVRLSGAVRPRRRCCPLIRPLTLETRPLVLGHFGAPALGLVGLAIGVATASLLSLSIALFLLLTGRCRLRLRPRHFAPDARVLRHLASRAWQPALHMIVPTLLMVGYMTISGRYGTDVQAAYTIGLRIESLPVVLSFPIANACATLVGQNLGAGRPLRAWRAIGAGYALELAVTSAIALVLLLAREQIVGVFSQDPEVIPIASEYLLFACVNVMLVGTYFVSFRALQGAGDMLSPMIASIAAALLVALPLALWLTANTSLGRAPVGREPGLQRDEHRARDGLARARPLGAAAWQA